METLKTRHTHTSQLLELPFFPQSPLRLPASLQGVLAEGRQRASKGPKQRQEDETNHPDASVFFGGETDGASVELTKPY